MMEDQRGCMKCGSNDAATKGVAMTGTGFSKVFDVQNNQFTIVYCKNCGYTEFYKTDSSTGGNVLDFFLGG